jgi:ribosome-associated protein
VTAVLDKRQDRLPSEALARRIAEVADAKQGQDVVALDMRSLVGYTDFLVICTARNERLAKAIHEEVYQRLKHDHGLLPATIEGEGAARWVLMDYLDCVFHVFVPELRERYRLEVLWGEAPRLELGAETGAGGRTTAHG